MRDFKLIFIFIFLFIIIRSINFSEHLNFSFDQAWTSARTREIWQNKEVTLVGPGNSIIVNGKQVIQGSINFYYYLPFLLIGQYDPIITSYLIMVFIALMMIPLYYGVKLLHGKKVAIFSLIIFTLVPYYVDFTRFVFGPVFQLSILPWLILSMGLYKKYKQSVYLFFVFLIAGILLQFHYQIIVVIGMLSFYYLWKSQTRLKMIFTISVGLIIGYLPMIIFEIKNQFYNFKIAWEYIQFSKKPSDFFFVPHRYLTICLLLVVLVAPFYKKFLDGKVLIATLFTLLLIDLFLYLPVPKTAFGMSPNWNYLMERKAYEIIKREGLKDFNIVNHIYDNKSVVIKYHLKLDNYDFDYDDYYHNKFLFVISQTDDIFQDPAYELNTFKPNNKLKEWQLNDTYNLYLFERISSNDNLSK